jgi:hypothetical protein
MQPCGVLRTALTNCQYVPVEREATVAGFALCQARHYSLVSTPYGGVLPGRKYLPVLSGEIRLTNFRLDCLLSEEMYKRETKTRSKKENGLLVHYLSVLMEQADDYYWCCYGLCIFFGVLKETHSTKSTVWIRSRLLGISLW